MPALALSPGFEQRIKNCGTRSPAGAAREKAD
jgi:hypothetical protein